MIELTQFGWAGVLFAFLIGHALSDFALQSEFMAEAKCPAFWNDQDSATGCEWLFVLLAHSLIHAGAVWLITGSMLLGLVELVLHAAIDGWKCAGKYGFLMDQGLHILCKVGFVIAMVTIFN